MWCERAFIRHLRLFNLTQRRTPQCGGTKSSPSAKFRECKKLKYRFFTTSFYTYITLIQRHFLYTTRSNIYSSQSILWTGKTSAAVIMSKMLKQVYEHKCQTRGNGILCTAQTTKKARKRFISGRGLLSNTATMEASWCPQTLTSTRMKWKSRTMYSTTATQLKTRAASK